MAITAPPYVFLHYSKMFLFLAKSGKKKLKGLGTVVRNNPNFDFFNYAGLYRPVKIYTTPHVYVQMGIASNV
ncbi:hypothetical protein GS3922_11575 [Geobacillus subterraneus]|uniref:Uncharacterized protein n=1 Tax=Geobacillus subterraneus TaxID=129338 RepID=A0ABN4NHV5_9BACL|nr:hypothetical protein GS3922_11575 [Geobacillus subterraneus]